MTNILLALMCFLLVTLFVGCVGGPTIKRAQLDAIQPGTTTKADLLKLLGEPTGVAKVSASDFEEWRWNKFHGFSQYDPVELLTVQLTNGVVRSFDHFMR